VWTVEQALQYTKQGIWPTAGNQDPANIYIEYLFSTYLYTGNGSTQTITNGINLSGKGGLVWIKGRTDPGDGAGVPNHILFDTVRGNDFFLRTSTTAAQGSGFSSLFQFQNNGFTVGNNHSINYGVNNTKYVSWTFREQPKFFDIVTFTSASSGNTTFNHNLGSTPGCVFIKNTQTSDPWIVYHTSVGNNAYLQLNSTAAQDPLTGAFSVSSTSVTISSSLMYTSQSYVAYVFASNAGGFGASGTENVISCGSFTTDAFKTGYATLPFSEAQWILVKCASNAGSWFIVDNMRGIYTNSTDANGLSANTSAAETTRNIDYGLGSSNSQFKIFGGDGVANSDYVYIAIRRGPMQVPTLGTTVYNTVGGSGANPAYVAGFPVDLALRRYPGTTQGNKFYSRLTGTTYLDSTSTAAEVTDANGKFDYQNAWFSNPDGAGYYSWMWKRAPGFFDEVCYTGSLPSLTVPHNLQAVPELIIVKGRSAVFPASGYRWTVYSSTLGTANSVFLNTDEASAYTGSTWGNTTPTSTNFYVGNQGPVNYTGEPLVAYLFATCPGVSKVGSYTGNGTTQTINCGFTGGARFVLIKRTDSTGDWYVWDTVRGMVSGTDPSILLNSTAAEVNANSVYTTTGGFQIVSTAAGINASGGTYIFLAIA
jgi:hypothetical protein